MQMKHIFNLHFLSNIKLLQKARNVPIYVGGLSIIAIPQALYKYIYIYIYICPGSFTILAKLNPLGDASLCSCGHCRSDAVIKQVDLVLLE